MKITDLFEKALLVLLLCVSSCSNNPSGESPFQIEDTNYVFAGLFPQRKVTSPNTKGILKQQLRNLPTADDSNEWTILYKDCTWYKDITYSGNTYRAVYFNEYIDYYDGFHTSQPQEMNGYEKGNVYFFSFEPIQWEALKSSSDEAMLMSRYILDCTQYYKGGDIDNQKVERTTYDSSKTEKVYDSNYQFSDLRGYLNTNFYNIAFSETEKEFIKTTLVVNSRPSIYRAIESHSGIAEQSKIISEDTNDKIYVLSYDESKEYEFIDGVSSDYAKCLGIGEESSWTRTPFYRYGANMIGDLSFAETEYMFGVRPVINVFL